MNNEFKRISPEEALKTFHAQKRGHLKIFIGYAPGVGKTYAMLNEANRRLKGGEDIVVGYVESHEREETDSQIGSLDIIPRRNIEYNGVIMEEMDTEAIMQRKPAVVVIDELAHNNAPGSKYHKRYEDVEQLLENGIDVITTLNIQHLESLHNIVKQITGITVNELIPDHVVNNADEIVVIDISPDALLNRLNRGNIYKLDKVQQALKNFYRKGNLNALREIALRQTADEVDEELKEYMKAHDIKDNWHTVERVLVCISSSISAKKLIRRGARIANKYKCEWIVASVKSTKKLATRWVKKNPQMLESNFQLAEQLGAEVITLTGKSVSSELARFAEEKHITQIIIGQANRTKFETIIRGSTVTKLLRYSKNIEVHIIPNDL